MTNLTFNDDFSPFRRKIKFLAEYKCLAQIQGVKRRANILDEAFMFEHIPKSVMNRKDGKDSDNFEEVFKKMLFSS